MTKPVIEIINHTHMKKYSDLSASEKLALDENQLVRSIELEAIERGIPLPTKLTDALKLTDAKGFWMPADASKVYEICAKNRGYGDAAGTGIAFQTEAQALVALQGALAVVAEGYDATRRFKLVDPGASFEIRVTHIIHVPQKGYWTKLEQLTEDNEKFDALCEECRADLEKVRQKDYDNRVLQVQRQQYIDLANGDEAVARAFWQKTKGTPFPDLTTEAPERAPSAAPVPSPAIAEPQF